MDESSSERKLGKDTRLDRRKVLGLSLGALASALTSGRSEAQGAPIDVGTFFYAEAGSRQERRTLVLELLERLLESTPESSEFGGKKYVSWGKTLNLGDGSVHAYLERDENGKDKLYLWGMPRPEEPKEETFTLEDDGLTGNLRYARTHRTITAEGRVLDFDFGGIRGHHGLEDAHRLYRGILEKFLASF